jgi:hypothetical protein
MEYSRFAGGGLETQEVETQDTRKEGVVATALKAVS